METKVVSVAVGSLKPFSVTKLHLKLSTLFTNSLRWSVMYERGNHVEKTFYTEPLQLWLQFCLAVEQLNGGTMLRKHFIQSLCNCDCCFVWQWSSWTGEPCWENTLYRAFATVIAVLSGSGAAERGNHVEKILYTEPLQLWLQFCLAVKQLQHIFRSSLSQ